MDKKENVAYAERQTTIHDWSPVNENGQIKSSEEIEHDIENTRHTMDEILDALGGKTNPNALWNKTQQYFQDVKNRETIKRNLTKVKDSVANSFQRNPLPAIMLAAGATWMLWETQRDGHVPSHDGKTRARFDEFRNKAGERFESARERVTEAFESAKGRAGEMSETARGKAHEYTSGAKERTQSYSERMQERRAAYRENLSEAQRRTQAGMQRADSSVHNNALAFGAVAAIAGIVTGLLFPETKTEERYVGEKAGDIVEKAGETGKGVAREATEAASNKAKEEGIAPEQLSQKAKEVTKEPGPVTEKAEQKSVTPGDIGSRTVETVKAATNKVEQKTDRKT